MNKYELQTKCHINPRIYSYTVCRSGQARGETDAMIGTPVISRYWRRRLALFINTLLPELCTMDHDK